jgi:prepilin-type processing-associated H-X9-DG protein
LCFSLDKIRNLSIIATCLFYKTTKRQNDKTTKRQNVKNVENESRAFTLLETVFTITIIGILLAIFLPVVSAIKLSAQKLKDASNLKTIAAAWKTYTIDNNFGVILHPNTAGGFEFVHYLSGGCDIRLETGWQGQERCILNDPYVYISSGDRYAAKVVKEAISSPVGNQHAYLESYVRTKNDITTSTSAVPLSYCLISDLSASVPLDTTPFGFTRGLKANGKWHPKYGLYGDKGGYVVYCDGHVTWFDGSRPAKFLKWDQSGYSADIRDAVPSSAFISSGFAMNDNIKDSDNSLLIIQHFGTGGV